MALGSKSKLILGIIGAIALVAAWQYLSYLFKFGYSRGTRTGIIRKISVKGPPYCKYLSGELALQGNFGQAAEIWEFSVDNHADSNPLVQALHGAERATKPVTVEYRQDRPIWWRCNPAEYFITGIEKN
jgi:hypothetical protein